MGDEFDINVNDLTTDEEALAEPEVAEEPALQEVEQAPAEAVSARKPGLLNRLALKFNQLFSRIHLPEWDWRIFLYGLVALIILVLLWYNWPAVRIDLLVWRFDAPKSVVFLVSLALGAGLLRVWQIYTGRRGAEERAEEQPSADSES